MTECARAGLGQSCRIQTGLRNPSPANNPQLYFPNKRIFRERGVGWEDSAFTGAMPRFLVLRMQQKDNPTRRAVEGSFFAT